MLALSFLLLIGVTLVADGLGFHVEKGYIYAAMGFAVFVEALNLAGAQAASGQGRGPAAHVRQGRAERPARPPEGLAQARDQLSGSTRRACVSAYGPRSPW